MIYILVLFIILFIIILFYFINKNIIIEKYFEETQQEQEEQKPIIYSKNVCGRVGKECSIINNKTNTCCNGLYCVRPKGYFRNKFCSKTPDDNGKGKSFKDGVTKFGNYMNKLKDKIFIQDCPYDEEGNEINNNYKLKNMCNNGFYKIPIPCMSKKKSNNTDFEFPETTLFSSVGDRNCVK